MLPHRAKYRVYAENIACVRAFIWMFDENAICGERDLEATSFEAQTVLTRSQLFAIKGVERTELLQLVAR